MGLIFWKLNPVLGREGSGVGNSKPLLTHTRFQLLRQGTQGRVHISGLMTSKIASVM